MQLKKPLTKFGHAYMAEEHFFLSKRLRPKILDGIQTAAAEGDRSENAEYIYGKKRLRETDRRIRYLNNLLTDSQIIDPSQTNQNQIGFATSVCVRKEDGSEHKYDIVGEGENDFYPLGISWKSPVAKALMGKKVGDYVEIKVPAGWLELEVIQICNLSSPKTLKSFETEEIIQ